METSMIMEIVDEKLQQIDKEKAENIESFNINFADDTSLGFITDTQEEM